MFSATPSWTLAREAWQWLVAVLTVVLAIISSGHAVLYKRDSRAAIAWVGFVWMVPLVGPVLYFLFAVNRVRRRANLLRSGFERFRAQTTDAQCSPEDLHRHLPKHTGHLQMLARVVDKVVERPLVPGNRIEPLINGDETFPEMLEAIRQARHSVSLATYIFDRDEIGMAFAKALGEATRRGVEVRVLIDAAGTRYSWPTILHSLRAEGVRYARFLPLLSIGRLLAMNLRTHRKILVCDGLLGFTGGLNIRVGHCLKSNPSSPIQDLHFRVQGPVVTQMQEAFADDWLFGTGESLRGEKWFPKPTLAGEVFARGVIDGPDEDFEKLRWTLLGALSIARQSIQIVTPYFLPDRAIIAALNVASMRGVKIDIILPARSNLPFVHWASRAMWWQVLEHGCQIWLTPPPFDHSKIMLVDGCWALVGSANWDSRSLRLNFEFNLECYDLKLAERLTRLIFAKRAQAHQVTLQDVDARPLPVRLLDGIARLATPYF
jgi:cardiolipin synthase